MATLYITPKGGLANRLMCILSGMRVAYLYDMDYAISWERDEHLNAPVTDLFYNDGDFRDGNFSDLQVTFRYSMENGIGTPFLPTDVLLSGGDVLIESNVFFHPQSDIGKDPASVLRQLRAEFRRLPIANSVREALLQFDGIDFSGGIGLHVRRPFPSWREYPEFAREEAYERPSDDDYINVTRTLRGRGFDGPIYLSTNSIDSRNYISERLGDVYFYDSPSYDNSKSASAVSGALVDMLMLSRTGVVSRQDYSTFAMIPTIIGGCAQCIIREDGSPMLGRMMAYLHTLAKAGAPA